MIRQFISIIATATLCLVLVTAPVVYAEETDSNNNTWNTNDYYAVNDINFYADVTCASSTSAVDGPAGNVSADSVWEDEDQVANSKKIFLYLISNKVEGNNNQPLNAVQAAAVVGNLWQESRFNTKESTGSYSGIAQWDRNGRYLGIEEPRDDMNNQLAYLIKEMSNNSYKPALDEFWSADAEDKLDVATFAFVRNYEVAVKGGGGSTRWSSISEAEATTQEFGQRYKAAQSAYKDYKDLAPELGDDSCSSAGNPNIDGYVFPFGIGSGTTKQSDLTSWYGAVPSGPTPDGGDLCEKSLASQGQCHHGPFPDPAIDLTVKESYNQGAGYQPKGESYYAIYNGTITSISNRHGLDYCNDVMLRGDDGWVYWYGHGSNWAQQHLEVGQIVKAGDKINEMGVGACADGTSPHEHIDRGSPKGDGGGREGHRDKDMPNIMNKLYKTLPK